MIYLLFVYTASFSQITQGKIDSIRFYAIPWNLNVRRLPLDPNQFEPEKYQQSSVCSNVIIDSVDLLLIHKILLKIKKNDRHYLDVNPRIKCYCYLNGEVIDVFILGTSYCVYLDNKVFKNGRKLKKIFSKYLPENYFPNENFFLFKFIDKVWYITKIKCMNLFY